MRTPAVLPAAAALALIAAGCGTPGPAQDVFDEAAGAQAGCSRILGARPGGAHVQRVRVDGEVASADVSTSEGVRRLALSSGPEGWRIEGPH